MFFRFQEFILAYYLCSFIYIFLLKNLFFKYYMLKIVNLILTSTFSLNDLY